MGEPGFISILSLSPQARGRIERLQGTFQDRIVSKLRIVGVTNDREANLMLWNLLPQFSRRFAVPAREPSSAYRPVPDDFNPEEVFCFKIPRIQLFKLSTISNFHRIIAHGRTQMKSD
jgi:hypothetical protein